MALEIDLSTPPVAKRPKRRKKMVFDDDKVSTSEPLKNNEIIVGNDFDMVFVFLCFFYLMYLKMILLL